MFSQTVTSQELELFEAEINRFAAVREKLSTEYDEIIERTVCSSIMLVQALNEERVLKCAEINHYYKKRNDAILQHISFLRTLAEGVVAAKTVDELDYLTKQIELMLEGNRLMQCLSTRNVNAEFLQDLSSYSVEIVNTANQIDERRQVVSEKETTLENEAASIRKSVMPLLALQLTLFAIGFLALLLFFPSLIITPIYLVLGMAIIARNQIHLGNKIYEKHNEQRKVWNKNTFYQNNNATFFANKSMNVMREGLRYQDRENQHQKMTISKLKSVKI